jgi:hypothetical protein
MTEWSHDARIAAVLTRLRETSDRFAARLEAAGSRAEQASSGWTPAQIAVHVALVNDNLASVIEGTRPGAAPPAADFQERPWADVVGNVPPRNESPARFHPPATVMAGDALQQFRQSVSHLARAIETLPADRAGYCISNRAVGTITLYQAGDFAIAHMIRHNQQTKRILEG